MAPLTVICVLLVALVHQPTLASRRRIMNPGEEFRLRCSLRVPDNQDLILQFFREKTLVKMFNSKSSTDKLRLVSNGTEIVPGLSNYTDRYGIEVDTRDGQLVMVIKNVTESDSAWYGCRHFNVPRNTSFSQMGSTELLVPGPFGGVFWTSNSSGLSQDVAQENEIPDGGTILTDNAWYGPNVACAVLVSNVEPEFNITIGRFGEPGSVDITDQFEPRSSSVVSIDNVGVVYRATVFFTKKWKFRKTSLRDVYCRASVLGTTYEKSVNIQVTSKPKNKACSHRNVAALIGSKNVNLTCLIEAHPEPYVEWILPGGRKFNALSNNPNYTVTNEARFEGLFTTLTISEVTEGIYDFGRIAINATNSEGSGEYYLYFEEGNVVGAAASNKFCVALITMATGLVMWMLR